MKLYDSDDWSLAHFNHRKYFMVDIFTNLIICKVDFFVLSVLTLYMKLKILAAEQDKRHNDILEEAIVDILRKYGKKVPKKVNLTSI